jgi:hypothetical protein
MYKFPGDDTKIMGDKKPWKVQSQSLGYPRPCPVCGAWSLNPESIDAQWEADVKRYHVVLTLSCLHHPIQSREEVEIPLIIAENSACSCGKTLSLKNHKIKRVRNNIEFEGTYECDGCHSKKAMAWHDLKKTVGRIWKESKRITLGPEGVTFERN